MSYSCFSFSYPIGSCNFASRIFEWAALCRIQEFPRLASEERSGSTSQVYGAMPSQSSECEKSAEPHFVKNIQLRRTGEGKVMEVFTQILADCIPRCTTPL